MNHNILHKIIDKVALIKWKNKMKVMNNIYTKVVKSALDHNGSLVLHGCFNCGNQNGQQIQMCIKSYNSNTICTLLYNNCVICNKKKCPYTWKIVVVKLV